MRRLRFRHGRLCGSFRGLRDSFSAISFVLFSSQTFRSVLAIGIIALFRLVFPGIRVLLIAFLGILFFFGILALFRLTPFFLVFLGPGRFLRDSGDGISILIQFYRNFCCLGLRLCDWLCNFRSFRFFRFFLHRSGNKDQVAGSVHGQLASIHRIMSLIEDGAIDILQHRIAYRSGFCPVLIIEGAVDHQPLLVVKHRADAIGAEHIVQHIAVAIQEGRAADGGALRRDGIIKFLPAAAGRGGWGRCRHVLGIRGDKIQIFSTDREAVGRCTAAGAQAAAAFQHIPFCVLQGITEMIPVKAIPVPPVNVPAGIGDVIIQQVFRTAAQIFAAVVHGSLLGHGLRP